MKYEDRFRKFRVCIDKNLKKLRVKLFELIQFYSSFLPCVVLLLFSCFLFLFLLFFFCIDGFFFPDVSISDTHLLSVQLSSS